MILLKNVSKTYRGDVRALKNIDLEIKKGEFVYVIGPTGCGKSTLIKVLDGEIVPDSGEVYVADVNVGKLRHSKVPIYRRNIGVIFQDFRLLPNMTVFENIAFAMEVLAIDRQSIRRRVQEILCLVDLQDKARAYPHELSGGQMQRATIARAIANHPAVLIADEPTGNLDPEKSKEIIQLLNKINVVEGTTVLMVTHDANLVNLYKKRTIMLKEGSIVTDMMKGGYIS